MATLRSRRLESLLGAAIDSLTAESIASLVTNNVEEAYDLDFKEELYGNGDSARRSLASDVAALANTAGGVIVIGIAEDENARATTSPGVEISDAETTRMRQIIASLVAPLPQLDILSVPGTDGKSGYYVIAVPRSPAAPHAVLINEGMRYPRRNGSTTRYLSEPEVAEAYRGRLVGVARQRERVETLESEAFEMLDRSDGPWVAVSLVPDVPGSAVIDHGELDKLRSSLVGREAWTVTPRGVSFRRARVGRRRLVADGGHDTPLARWVMTELHEDGSGIYALKIGDLHERARRDHAMTDGPLNALIDDEMVVSGILSGLNRLAIHARDSAATGGNVIVRAHLLPPPNVPAMELGHTRFHGIAESRSQLAHVGPVPPAEAAADLDDLASPGPALAATAAQLANDLGQTFGIAELGQFTRDGKVRRPYWSGRFAAPRIIEWAEAAGIDVTDDTL